MFVGGLTVESKKISISRKGQVKAEEARPCSSELPDIYELRSHTNNKISSQPAHTKSRNSSHNKIYMTNKISEKPPEPKEYLSENKIPPRPLKKKESNVGRRSKKLEISKEEGEECLYQMEDRLLAYYRYYPVAVVAGCGLREDLMKSLNERGDFVGYAPKGKKLQRKGLQELWNKLIKLAQLKGKYKFREKFNVQYSAQLKSLGYKRKEPKRKKESESSSSEEEVEKKEKCRDMETWKKSMGVEGSKVFIVKGKYKDLRNALMERGWVENEDRQSLFYDLKWTTKVNDVNFDTLRPHQLVNHFNNNACLTSKYGICKSLRSIMFSEAVEVDRFFPKAYDMSDLQDFENFLEMYKWTYCESIIKKALLADADPSQEELMRLKVACLVTSRRLLRGDKLLVNITNSRYNLCTFNEWRFLTAPKECNMDEILEDFKLWEMEEWGWGETRKEAHSLLEKLTEREPQAGLNGCGNIWIVKPACNSLKTQSFPAAEASSVSPTSTTSSTTPSGRRRSTWCRSTSRTR